MATSLTKERTSSWCSRRLYGKVQRTSRIMAGFIANVERGAPKGARKQSRTPAASTYNFQFNSGWQPWVLSSLRMLLLLVLRPSQVTPTSCSNLCTVLLGGLELNQLSDSSFLHNFRLKKSQAIPGQTKEPRPSNSGLKRLKQASTTTEACLTDGAMEVLRVS